MKTPTFSNLLGKTITSIEGANKGSGEIRIKTSDGKSYRMYHYQDCCEYVRVEDIVGDVSDLVGKPVTMAEEVSNADDPKPYDDDGDTSHTWTFYKLATVKGYVTLRWLGESNGYYSESVDFEEYES